MAESFSAENANIALTAGTAKSVVVLTTTSTSPMRVIEFTVSCDATATGLLKVEMLVGTLTGGTTGTAPTVARMTGGGYFDAPNTTATYYTAEPTYTKNSNNGALVVKTIVLPLPATTYDIEYPLGREWYLPVSSVLAVRLTSTTVSPNTWTNVCWDE